MSEVGLGDGRPRLLLVTTEPQPPPYHSLREIFGRLLPARGYDVGWVLTDRVSELAGADGWRPRGTVWTIGTAHRRAGAPLAATHLRRRTETAALRAAVARGEWDVVLVRDDPWLALLFARACRKSGTPLVFQLSHLKEEETIEHARRGIYGSRALNLAKALVALAMRRRVLDLADLVLAISDELGRCLRRGSLGRISHGRVGVLPEGAPGWLLDRPADGQPVRRRLGLGDDPVLVYAGTLNRTRRPELLLPILARVRQRHPTARLIVVGDGLIADDRRRLEVMAATAGLTPSVRFTGPVPLGEVPSYVAAADVALCCLPLTPVLRHNSPAKLFEYLALGRPVVASDTPEQSEVLQASQAGFAVPFAVEPFAEAIVSLLDRPADARRCGELGREYVRRLRTFETLTDRLEEMLGQLAAGRQSQLTA